MIKFESQYDEDSPKVTMYLHSDSTLDEVTEVFERFLRAMGYHFDGTVDIVEEEKADEEA